MQELAQGARADGLASDAVQGHRPLLGPDLKDAIVLAYYIDQHAAFVNAECQRFFGVDIFSRLAGVDAGCHALPFLGGDDHCIDVFTLEDLVVVLIDRPGALMIRLELLRPRQIAITEGNEFSILGQLLEQEGRTSADPDRAHRNAPVGARFAVGRQDAAGNKIRGRNRAGRSCGGELHKLST